MAGQDGLFIVLEGSDGSGKTTQFNLLKERLKAVGYDVEVFDFPRYDKQSSHFVKNYLNGRYGPALSISPYAASLFYALDRYEAAPDIKKALKAGKIVLANRYAGSNMAHQGSKFEDEVERRSFFVWADNLEFQLLAIPRPDINFFLRVPYEVSFNLIAQKNARSYTKSQRDEHENDKNHLKKSVATYDLLCQLFPKDFKAIECTKDDKLMSVAEINNLIWGQLKPLLPAKKPRASHSVVVSLGLDNKSPINHGESDESELSHIFNDASLWLKLHLQRTSPKCITSSSNSWDSGEYTFFTPSGLPKDVNSTYKQTLQRMAQIHAQLGQKLEKYLKSHLLNQTVSGQTVPVVLKPLTPLCALTDVSLKLKKNEVSAVAGSLLSGDNDELQWAAKQLYAAARQKWPQDFAHSLESKDGPVPLNNIIAKLVEDRLPQAFSLDSDIKLIEAGPRLEFDLLAESIYPFSSLSLDELSEEVSNWPYLQKYTSLKEAAAQPEVLKKVRYKLDVISDQITLNRILSAGQIKDVQVQSFTPRYGYQMPEIIEAAALDDLYDAYFDESLKLYSVLQGSGQEDVAPYATLLGHKLRWQLSVNAGELKAIINDPKLSGQKIVNEISDKISEVHPILSEIIRGAKPLLSPPHRNGKSRVKPASKPRSAKRRGGNPKKS